LKFGGNFRDGMQQPAAVFKFQQATGRERPALAARAFADSPDKFGRRGKIAHRISVEFGSERGVEIGGDEFALGS
jgi:hypothetical protein